MESINQSINLFVQKSIHTECQQLLSSRKVSECDQKLDMTGQLREA